MTHIIRHYVGLIYQFVLNLGYQFVGNLTNIGFFLEFVLRAY